MTGQLFEKSEDGKSNKETGNKIEERDGRNKTNIGTSRTRG